MPSEEAIALAASHRGLVIAPAGCGKTYLLAEAVSCASGRQLILTHTHAGVRAIRGHLKRHAVPLAKYGITTIDGFALRYASSFPGLSGWNTQISTGVDWRNLRVASLKVLRRSAIRRVLTASYSGAFIDEYQDCSLGQHQLLKMLSEFMPVRAVGDPLQAIFAILNQGDACPWSDVEQAFDLVAEISTPHRWIEFNKPLGEWLLDVRRRLISGLEIDLRGAPLDWQRVAVQKQQGQLKACYGVKTKKGESLIALRKWRPECHRLARSLKGRYRAMETVECDDLLEWAQRIEQATGLERAGQLVAFADACIAKLPTTVKQFVERLGQGKPVKPKRPDYQRVVFAIEAVRASTALHTLPELMDALTNLDHSLVRARDELWREMKRTLREHRVNPAATLRQTAWNMRNRLRHIGGRVAQTALGTPLLVKGLEFDHAVVLDADDHGDAESLYVAMTRGSRTLTILSDEPILRRARPQYAECGTSSLVQLAQ